MTQHRARLIDVSCSCGSVARVVPPVASVECPGCHQSLAITSGATADKALDIIALLGEICREQHASIGALLDERASRT